MVRNVLAVLATFALATGCAEEPAAEPTFGDEFGTPDNPIPQDTAYTVSTRMVVGYEASQVANAVAGLKAMSTNPARALLAAGGGTALAQVYADLNTSLDDRLEGWLNTELDKTRIAGKTLRQLASDLAMITETSLTQFALESNLKITPTGATHILSGINFRPAGLDIVVPIGGLKADSLSSTLQATLGAGGALSLGTQSFGFDFGPHAWHGIGLATDSLYGTDVESAITTALACRTVAQAVAARCYNGACVGHASQLQTICEDAAAAVADGLAEHVTGFQITSFRLMRGTARLVDDNLNGEAERNVDGRWEAEIDVGSGPRAITATFEALR